VCETAHKNGSRQCDGGQRDEGEGLDEAVHGVTDSKIGISIGGRRELLGVEQEAGAFCSKRLGKPRID
jgi:hypothetical protein